MAIVKKGGYRPPQGPQNPIPPSERGSVQRSNPDGSAHLLTGPNEGDDVMAKDNSQPGMKDFDQLQVAVQDLLTELRVEPSDLHAMAEGYSPDYPGGPNGELPSGSRCKIQISMVVANKLIGAKVLGAPTYE